jgi:hypothetical protein
LKDKNMQQVESFKYKGTTINHHDIGLADIKLQIEQVTNVLESFNSVFWDNSIT